MQSERYIAELKPIWKFVEDEPAPLATKCLFLTSWGNCVIGTWYDGCQFICWAGLPKLLPEQQRRFQRLMYGSRLQIEEFSEGC